MAANKKDYNQYFTPEHLAIYLVNQIPTRFTSDEISVVDLAVGEGILLKCCKQRWEGSKLFGVDIDDEMVNTCSLSCPEANIMIGDSLDELMIQQLIEANDGMFELGVANPPFKKMPGDEFGRIEGLFLKQYEKLLVDNGLLAIILPNGILTSINNKNLRQYILNHFSVLKIINLPERLFSQVDTKVSILYLEKTKYKNNNVPIIKLDENFQILDAIEVKVGDLIERMNLDYYLLDESVDFQLPTVKLQNIIKTFRRGYTAYGENRFFVPEGLRYLHSFHVEDGWIDYSNKEMFIQADSIMDAPTAHVKLNDIVMVRVGRDLAKRMAIIEDIDDYGVASDCIYIFEVDQVDPYYFVLFFKTSVGQGMIKGITHGTGANIVSKKDFLNLEIPVLPLKLQNELGSKYRTLLRRIKQNRLSDKLILDNLLEELNTLIVRLELLLGG